MLVYSNAFSQAKTIPNSFEIIENTLVTQETFYKKSIENANFENYRLKNDRVKIMFENGFVLELLSAKELFIKNLAKNIDNYAETFPVRYELPLFFIQPNGQIVGRVTPINKRSQLSQIK